MKRAGRQSPPDVSLGDQAKATEFASGRWWITLSGGKPELPYPVAISVGVGSGGRLRCTGLMLRADADEGTEITSASLRGIRIPELLQAVGQWQAMLGTGAPVDPGVLERMGLDPAEFIDPDDGVTYLPALISYSGPRSSRPPLDQLFPGMVPDVPAKPYVRGGPLPRSLFETVAAEYRKALTTAPAAPVAALCKSKELRKLRGGRPITEPTARRWVQRCRDMGLLGKSVPGKAGEYSEGAGDGAPMTDSRG